MYIDTRQLLSDAKFYESYSRFNEELKRYETWEEAVDRVIDMHRKYYSHLDITAELDVVSKAYKNKLVLGSQRALQFGGDQLLKHHIKLYNCVSSYADRPEFFGEYFYVLLGGAGAGFSVQKHHIDKLPNIIQRTKAPKIHVVEDSIEGWATAVDVLLSSYFENGGKHPEFKGHRVYFDLSQIRPKGSKISGGFKAPGPEPLRMCLDRIEYLLQGAVLGSKKAKLKSIIVYDICMHIADATLSGGVRRSATICLFSPDDEDMLKAKTGNWFVENPQRARSNNSAVIVRSKATQEMFHKFMEHIKQFGEPGFLFVESDEHTTNPCVEIGMYPVLIEDGEKKSGWQGCNLVEINGGQCTSEEEFYSACEAGSILATLQAGYTDFRFLSDTSKKIFEREALLGVSVTGWMANPNILLNEDIMKNGAKKVVEVNKRVAKKIGINPAARTTCVKPSGNASVLLKTPSGIHADHSRMYIRNVQMNKDTETAKVIKQLNPHMVEDSVWSASGRDYIISFPIIANSTALLKDDFKGVKHLEIIKKVQQNWVEFGTDVELCVDPTVRHNVSNTVIVDDWDSVEKYLFENRFFFAGVSFISSEGDRVYNQAPNTKIVDGPEIISAYGDAALFASGLIVDGLNVFPNLWDAINAVSYPKDLNSLQEDWVRRYNKFADNYFDSDKNKMEMCLKDVYLLHKWNKIQANLVDINWITELTEKKFIDVDTLGASACVGNGPDSCLI